MNDFQMLTEIILSANDIPPDTVRDRNDDIILAAAVGGKAEYLITGDDDLLSLVRYRNIGIISPANMLLLIA